MLGDPARHVRQAQGAEGGPVAFAKPSTDVGGPNLTFEENWLCGKFRQDAGHGQLELGGDAVAVEGFADSTASFLEA